MDVSFTLWSLQQVLAKIPFDSPAKGPVDLDFSHIAVPYYVRDGFKVSIEYEDSLPYEAACAIYSPNHSVTVVIIMKRQYEEAFKARLDGDRSPETLAICTLRRELYCHEACHLISIIRAFPSERSSLAKEEFLEKVGKKFEKSIESDEDAKAVPLTTEKPGASPSIFDKDHFRYDYDRLNYFKLYQELMFPYDKMVEVLKPLGEIYKKVGHITFDDVAEETFISQTFFDTFHERLAMFLKLLSEEVST